MTTSDKFELLRDLARLLKKHGPDAFSALSEFLKNPEGINELVTILEAGAKAGRKAKVSKRSAGHRASRETLNNVLSEVERSEPYKAKLLSGFFQALHEKRLLPGLRDIRDFAMENGLGQVTATSRDRAILSILRDLTSRSTGELSEILERLRVHEHGGDRTLERWAEVILDKDRRHR